MFNQKLLRKKSKFIANLFYVENSEEAEKIIKRNKKENILMLDIIV